MIDWGALDATAFHHALATGLGRALLHTRQHGRVPDEDALWDACLHCQTYNWELEGHRAAWLWSVVHEAGLAAHWAGPLLAALPEATSVPDADQLAGLALCIARTGHDGAARALEAVLSSGPDPSLTVPGARELVELQGIAGLHTVFRVVGGALRSGDERHLLGLGAWMMAVEDILGVDVVANVLATSTDPGARAIREALADENASADADTFAPDPLGPGEREALFTTVRACATALAASRAPPLDAHDLARALARLGRQPPRSLDPILLALDAHESARVRRQLSKLLSHVRHPLLRGLALQGPLGHPDRLRWLLANFEHGDGQRVLAALDHPVSRDESYDRCAILLRLHAAHPAEGWDGALVHVYQHAPCSLAREDALVRLLDDDAAPVWLVAEACWDAHPDVATAAREALQA